MVRLLAYIFDLIVFVVIGRLIALIFSRLFGSAGPRKRSAPRSAARAETGARHGETVRDPVCGMFVSTELSHRLTHGGQTLHFCSQECLERYQKEAVHA
jgi:YHS domain-containing protein